MSDALGIVVCLLLAAMTVMVVVWMGIATRYRKMWLEARAQAKPKRNMFDWGLAGSASEQHWIHEGQRQNVARILVAHDGTESTFCGSCGRMVHHPDCPVVTAGAA